MHVEALDDRLIGVQAALLACNVAVADLQMARLPSDGGTP